MSPGVYGGVLVMYRTRPSEAAGTGAD